MQPVSLVPAMTVSAMTETATCLPMSILFSFLVTELSFLSGLIALVTGHQPMPSWVPLSSLPGSYLYTAMLLVLLVSGSGVCHFRFWPSEISLAGSPCSFPFYSLMQTSKKILADRC